MYSATTLELIEAGVAVVLIGLSLTFVPLALRRSWKLWQQASVRQRQLLLAAIAVAAALRWFIVPLRIATVFIGYRATTQAIDLFPAGHYGLGTEVLYHAVLSVLGPDHRWLMWTNAVLGVLTLPLVATVAARLFRSWRVGALTAALVAVVPLFVRNDTSDANNVPMLLWLFAGLVLFEAWWTEGRGRSGLPALVLFGAVSVSRPEALGLVVAGAVMVMAAKGRWKRPPRWTELALLAAMAGLVVPHLLHVLQSIERLDLGVKASRLELPHLLGWTNAVVHPLLFPTVLTLLAVWALLRPGPEGRRAPLAVLGFAATAFLLTIVDLDWANVARVHVPVALGIVMMAAHGAVGLLDRLRPSQRPWMALGLGLALMAGVALTAVQLWRPTNEEQEEGLIREAMAALPATPLMLVRPSSLDRDVSDPLSILTHMYFPDYLVTERPDREVESVDGFSKRRDFDRPVYFFQGLRCYARFRMVNEPPPVGEALQPACRAMRERFVLSPVWERRVKNHGDIWIQYYGDAAELPVGLYRVTERPGRAPGGSDPS